MFGNKGGKASSFLLQDTNIPIKYLPLVSLPQVQEFKLDWGVWKGHFPEEILSSVILLPQKIMIEET